MFGFFRHIALSALLLLAAPAIRAQQAAWRSAVEPLGGDRYRVELTAAIPAGYHIYDTGPYDDGGPNPTTLRFAPAEGVVYEGGVRLLDTPVRKYDPYMRMEIGTLSGTARFAQELTLHAPHAVLTADIGWMLCSDNSCMPPSDTQLRIEVGTPAADGADAAVRSDAPQAARDSASIRAASEPHAAGPAAADRTFWGYIIEAILWGFAALVTPCVFPMVPMTVSYFMKGEQSARRGRFRALAYGLFIVALYTLPVAGLILATRLIGGGAVTADIFNWLATHWLPNLLFFAVFMLFAASFFGAFELTLPSRLVNESDRKADRKGLSGIFFLALTLVLVSFSCTGPIVSSVLIKSTGGGEFWVPIATMLAFSTVFALPFTLLAFFPSLLSKLPRSGGWLNSVKIVLGFVEIALGLKFLSVADQTYHWGILDREVYLAIWIAVFALLGLYLLGKIRFAHDSEVPYLGVGRLAAAIAVFSFTVYLLPGMWGAPLKALSGYLPPRHTQDFVLGAAGAPLPTDGATPDRPKYGDFLRLPHGLKGFFDLSEAEAYAARVGKPLFIDITGHGCVNCREMEERVWSDPEVLRMLRDDYVIVALYLDDKKIVPESDWVTTASGKVLKSLGKINSNYVLATYGVNAQPYYVLQGRDGEVLAPPRGYDLDAAAFAAFLQRGLEAFRSGK